LFENPELNSELELRMENVRALKNLLLVTLLCWFFCFSCTLTVTNFTFAAAADAAQA